MPGRLKCPSCGNRVEAGRPACPSCGARLAAPRRGRGPLVWVAAAGAVFAALAAGVAWWALRPGEPAWGPASFPDGGFQVELPAGGPAARVTGLKLRPGARIRGSARDGREEYAVLFWDEFAPPGRSDAARATQVAAGLLADAPPARKVSDADADADGFAAREVAFEVPDRGVAGVVRVVVAGPRVFAVAAVGPDFGPEHPRARRFVDSFQVTDETFGRHRSTPRSAARAVGLVAAGRVPPFQAREAAFDPARGALWVAAVGRLGEVVPSGGPLDPAFERKLSGGGRPGETAPRVFYLRRYAVPGLQLEAEYRLANQLHSVDVIGDRLIGAEDKPGPAVVAFDLRNLPPPNPKAPPPLALAERSGLPGDRAPYVFPDPAGRRVYAAVPMHPRTHIRRFQADRFAAAEVLPDLAEGVKLDGLAVAPDGKTLTFAYRDVGPVTWVDVDAGAWAVKRRQAADRGPTYSSSAWTRLADRTFAAVEEGGEVRELDWSRGLVPDARPVLTAAAVGAGGKAVGLRLAPDGRHLFCLFAKPSSALAVVRVDARAAGGGPLPVCGRMAVEDLDPWSGVGMVVSPDGSMVAIKTGQVFAVTYPPGE